MRLAALCLLLATSAHAQSFLPANGPWTREHRLVGSAPDGRIFGAVGTRLAQTRDGGLTWTVLSETAALRRLVADGTALVGAFDDGVRRSEDAGATWEPWGLDGRDVLDVAVGGGRAFALASVSQQAPRVFRRAASGDWVELSPPPVPNSGQLNRLAVHGDIVALGGRSYFCQNAARGHVLRSQDGGDTWVSAEAGMNLRHVAVGPDGAVWTESGPAFWCVGSDVPEPPQFYRMAPNETVTQAAGLSPGGLALGADGRPVAGLLAADGPEYTRDLAAAGGFVIAQSDEAYGLCLDPPCFYQADSGLYAAREGRTLSVGFEPSVVRALAVRGDTLLAAADGAVFGVALGVSRADRWATVLRLADVRVFLSTPIYTLAWAGPSMMYSLPVIGAIGSGTPPELFYGARAAFDAASAFGRLYHTTTGWVYSSQCGVFVSEGYGIDASLLASDLRSLAAAGGALFAGVSPYDDPAAPIPSYCDDSSPQAPAVLMRLDAPGGAWTPDADGLAGASVFDVAQDPASGRLIAATDAGTFSRAIGEAWTADGLPGRTVRTLHEAQGALYAGTDAGLFRRDAGAWTPVGPEIADRTVFAIASGDADGEPWLAVGTDRGVWTTTPRFVEAAPVPASVAALGVRIAPNPGSGARRIVVSGDAAARVVVLDALGRTVADLGELRPGAHGWSDRGLPAGVYTLRATADGASSSVRVSVLR